LEILHFSNYAGDADSGIMRETWARLLDQALTRGGLAEGCSVLKRVGSKLYPGDGVSLPLDTICLHLEKAALVSKLTLLLRLDILFGFVVFFEKYILVSLQWIQMFS
jgi:hypothetical protein